MNQTQEIDLARQVLRGSQELDRMKAEIQKLMRILESWVPNLEVQSEQINTDWIVGHFWSIKNCRINIKTRVRVIFTFEKVFDSHSGVTVDLYSTLTPESIKVDHILFVHTNLHRLVKLVLETFPHLKEKPEVKAIMEAGAD